MYCDGSGHVKNKNQEDLKQGIYVLTEEYNVLDFNQVKKTAN